MEDAKNVSSTNLQLKEIALNSSIDLREYAANVDSELGKIENRMEDILTNFHNDLGNISLEIQDLQTQSLQMNKRLQNRQTYKENVDVMLRLIPKFEFVQFVRGELCQFLSDMAISEHLIRHILMTPVTDQEFLENLHELDHKINFITDQSLSNYRSFDEVSGLLKKLKFKAVAKIREFMLRKIYALRKPLANYQILQNQLVKFRFYNSFLFNHDREVLLEVMLEYVNTMSKVYFSYFKLYCAKLSKLLIENTIEKDDLLGKHPDKSSSSSVLSNANFAIGSGVTSIMNSTSLSSSTSGTMATSATALNRTGIYSLSNRALRVLTETNLESPIILPHVANTAEVKYPIEVLFRSVHYALLETVCREYYFLLDFFMFTSNQAFKFNSKLNGDDADDDVTISTLFEKVMGRSLGFVQKFTEIFVITSASHDVLGLLICVQLLHSFMCLARKRELCVLEKFWGRLTEMLWVKLTDRLDAHMGSIKQHLNIGSFVNDIQDLNKFSNGTGLNPKMYSLIRPHWITRRYAELAASLHAIGHEFPGTPLFMDNLLPSKQISNPNVNSCEELAQSSPSSIKSLVTSGTITMSNSLDGSKSKSSYHLDARILSRLNQLQTEFEYAINSLAKAFSRPRLAYVFLINNYDLVISVLTENEAIDLDELGRCRDAVIQHMSCYIDEALAPYFGSLISFIRDFEHKSTDLVRDSQTNHCEEVRVTRIVKGFNIDWKNSIEKIHDEIMTEFANMTLGSQIFQTLLAQLVQHYHRFQQVMTQSPYKSMPIRNQLVNIHYIMSEIKKCKPNY